MSSVIPAADESPVAILRRTDQVVDAFADVQRRQAALDAEEIRTLARAAALVKDAGERGSRREIAQRSLVAELAIATRRSEWSVSRQMGQCADLCERFGVGVAALERGEITRRHLVVIQEAGAAIHDDADRAAYLAFALERARTTSPGRLAPLVRTHAERFLDRTLDERARDAHACRRVELCDLPDGMAELVATLPATLAHGIHDRLSRQARSVVEARGDGDGGDGDGDGDGRTIDQVRADVFTDLLLTGAPDACLGGEGLGAIRAIVQVTVPVLTMTGRSDEPALLAGYGPIDGDTARALAAGATGWERVMTSPLTGDVLAVDRYRVTAGLQRFLRARDEHCRFPGCRKPVWRCDVDHTHDAARGGTTRPENLAHLCRRHHTLKHASAWTVEQTSPGVLVWTSPSGRRHTDRPEPTVRFVPEAEVLSVRTRLREPWLLPVHDPLGSRDAPF
ncbi:HNH endonuclease signature motif containing protein [uncultured Microbacterium sp.]|uniref:HNH endonuclease n=1 Tax=uncultured Microbacterium sp. TaxID=191216 RepID=A0A1Y5P5B7_9MICO|nr:HNH endonuclease signature motif containing protein [uncultured Microbacterium sp.]SBS72720.1 HNH endonuclease [uncultured Microbacterium sp.]